jgi:hypothetical protein
MLPPEVKRLLHQLSVVMWAAAYTPAPRGCTKRCQRQTPATDYRPIGLASTVCKLWTSVIQGAMSEFAESQYAAARDPERVSPAHG